MSTFKPLLASPVEDLDALDYDNIWVSAKLDGIRAIVRDCVVVSRNLKPIPNQWVQHLFGRPEYEHIDGELIVGDAFAKDCYRITNSGVMSKDGQPNVVFHAFDHIQYPGEDYELRRRRLRIGAERVHLVEQRGVTDKADLLSLEEFFLDRGFEGVMLRAIRGPNSYYKYGRSTAKQGTLLKLKRFVDEEAIVVGYEEEMENQNVATKDALGHTERSSHKENLFGKGRLGALICRATEGIMFKIGTGFDADTRATLWMIRDTLPGRLVKFKHFPIGAKEAPRFPVFLGFRETIDA